MRLQLGESAWVVDVVAGRWAGVRAAGTRFSHSRRYPCQCCTSSHLTATPPAPHNYCSITAWTKGLPNVLPPMLLDASAPDSWGLEAGSCRAVFAANLCARCPLCLLPAAPVWWR